MVSFGTHLGNRGVCTTPDIDLSLGFGSPVGIGVSGGKDSCVLAFEVCDYLDAIGHQGPRLLIHSDLGRVEWKDSLPTCERLAKATGLDLVVVRRKAGDMMDRWLVRWQNNLARYANLECVKLILPWSTPAMRFCTSELKTDVICRELIGRFPGQTIVSAVGIRREESTTRALAPIASVQSRLASVTHGTCGFNWNAILHWLKVDVFTSLGYRGFRLHEAYTEFDSTRVSCVFCTLGSDGDAAAAASCPDNTPIYIEQVGLEIASTFSYRENRWLGDVAPWLLTKDMRVELERAKQKAALRKAAESGIPAHLLFTKGWPTQIPTYSEACLLARVRRDVGEIMEIAVLYTDPEALRERYAQLMAEAQKKRKVAA